MKTATLLSAAAAVLMAGAAQATVQVTSGLLLTDGGALAAGETLLLDFENPNPEQSLISGADIVAGGDYGLFTGSFSGIAAAPLNNTSQYLAVFGSGPVNNRGEVTINFGLQASSFSIDVGSIDMYNSFQAFFFDSTSQTWTGADMTSTFQDWFLQASNRRITFAGNAGERFTAVKLISTQNSLEVDNLAVNAVPEPATWALMMLGFGLVGAAARRRSTGPVAVSA